MADTTDRVTRFAADLLDSAAAEGVRGRAARPSSNSTTGPGSDARCRASSPRPADGSRPHWRVTSRLPTSAPTKASCSTPRSPQRSRRAWLDPTTAGAGQARHHHRRARRERTDRRAPTRRPLGRGERPVTRAVRDSPHLPRSESARPRRRPQRRGQVDLRRAHARPAAASQRLRQRRRDRQSALAAGPLGTCVRGRGSRRRDPRQAHRAGPLVHCRDGVLPSRPSSNSSTPRTPRTTSWCFTSCSSPRNWRSSASPFA